MDTVKMEQKIIDSDVKAIDVFEGVFKTVWQ